MAGNRYEFDRLDFRIRRAGHRVTRALWALLRFVLSVLSLSVVAYSLVALFYSTNEEKALQAENELYSALYPGLGPRLDHVRSELALLKGKDELIYKDMFHSEAPAGDPVSSLGIFFGSDSIPDSKLVFYTARKSERLVRSAAGIDSLFANMVSSLKDTAFVMPPMTLPLDSASYIITGAGIGEKINPFYTTMASHNGVDFMAPPQTPVRSPADGFVQKVQKSRKGEGNTVSIKHKGGYVTRYAHLSEIKVQQGQAVRKGAVIGTVGMSGNSYAPHLHYEVRRDTTVLDPLGFIFASVTPEDYANYLFMGQYTQQSMD